MRDLDPFIEIRQSERDQLEADLKTAHEVIREFRAALEFYGDEENWQKPDQYVPYFTLWVDGDNVGYHRAKTILLKHAEFLKKIGANDDR